MKATTSCRDMNNIEMSIVEYFSGPSTKNYDHICTNGKCSLWGWLYVPKHVINYRGAIVFIHGHNKERHEPCAIANFFADNGFVVFAPVRSGNILVDDTHFKDWHIHAEKNVPFNAAGDIQNTGIYIDDWAKAQDNGNDFEAYRVKYLRDYQVFDVELALKYLLTLKDDGENNLADKGKIAVLGHSYGASLSVFFASKDFDVMANAIADISGGELSWEEGGPWAEAMHYVVKNRNAPIYFLQPADGANLGPTINLPRDAAITKDHQFQAAIFPEVRKPGEAKLSNDEVHTRFVDWPKKVATWGPSVIDFFERYFTK